MGKKQDEAGSSKRMTPKKSKLPQDKTHISKRQPGKPTGHLPVKSKPGFSLYSESEQEESKMKDATLRDIGSNKMPLINVDNMDEREVEVLTQIQLQGRMPSQSSCLPSTSLDVFDRQTPFDLPDVSTPFNKRLVSSTPDPERLLEVDLLEQQRYTLNDRLLKQSKSTEAQMIPERDIRSVNMPDVLTSLGSGLGERLRQQRQIFHQQLLQNEMFPKVLQKTLQDKPEGNTGTVAGAASLSQQQSSITPPLVVTKAEWVEEVQTNDSVRLAGLKKNSIHPKTANQEMLGASKGSEGYHTLGSATLQENGHAVQPDLQAHKSNAMVGNLEKGNISCSLKNANILHNPNESAFGIPEKIQIKSGSAVEQANNEHSAQNTANSTTITRRDVKKTRESSASIKVNAQKHAPHPKFKSPKLSKQNLTSGLLKESRKPSLKPVERDSSTLPTEGDQVPQKIVKDQLESASHNSPDEMLPDKVSIPIVIPTPVFDSSADSCDLEVSNVIGQPLNKQGIMGKEDAPEVKELNVSASTESSHLSQVIEFLKSDAFNANRDKQYENIRLTEVEGLAKSNETEQRVPPQTDVKETSKEESLDEIMSHYLPRPKSAEVISTNDVQVDPPEEADDLNATLKASEMEGGDQEEGNKKGDDDLNQNYNSDSEDENSRQRDARPRNLQYLESMPDPTLRDIACRLTFKATAIRDVELRDLIDDMIFHTDAALSRENARCKDSELYFSEESNKLKKRIQVLSQQLEAKEIEERMYTQAQKDVSQLERKNMFLKQEKEKLDTQVTNLLEERARWLTTQQDLVKTISMKDHELLKKNEKHLAEKKSLLQALDQATQNSQGVHYKLSLADKQVSNLEQRLKCKDLEIDDYKDKLKAANEKLLVCEANSLKKDQEMIRLQDLVDSLRIGVDHVLQAYETSASHGTTSTQRQGIDNLRQTVHPEQYGSFGSMKSNYKDHNLRDEPRPATVKQNQSSKGHMRPATSKKSSKVKPPIRPLPVYPKPPRAQNNSQDTRKKDRTQKKEQCCASTSREEKNKGGIARLTPEVLEEHNRRLSPVDRTLWHSLDNGLVHPPVFDDEPYHSDSEVEVHREARHQRKHHSNQEHDHPYNDLVDDLRFSADNERSRQREKDHIESSRMAHASRERRKSESDLHGRYGNAELPQSARSQGAETNAGLAAVPIIQSMEEVNISDGNYDRDSQVKKSQFLSHDNRVPGKGLAREVSHAGQPQAASLDTQYSTLRSETIPRSPVTSDDGRMVYLDDVTPYSTLRSEPIPKSPDRHDTIGKGKSHWSKSSYQERELSQNLMHDSHQTKNNAYRQAPPENIYSSTQRPKVSETQRQNNEIRTDSFCTAISQSQKSSTPHSSKETHHKNIKTPYPNPAFSHHQNPIPSWSDRPRDGPYVDDSNRDRHYLDDPNRDRLYMDDANRDRHYVDDSNRDRHYVDDSNRDRHYLDDTNRDRHYLDDPNRDRHYVDDANRDRHYVDDSNRDRHYMDDANRDRHYVDDSNRDRHYMDDANRDRHYMDDTNRDRHYLDDNNTLIQHDVQPSSGSYPDRVSQFQNTDHYHQHHSGFYSNLGASSRYQFDDSDLAHLDFYKINSNDRRRERPSSHSPGHHHDNSRYTVKFNDNVTTDSPRDPGYSLDSQFFNNPSTLLQTHSSPLCTSDTSFSRRATKGSTDNENISQRDFFPGTEFSESLSSISDTDQANPSFNNNGLPSMDDAAFSTGIAALDEKIANLQQKINRTKSIFS